VKALIAIILCSIVYACASTVEPVFMVENSIGSSIDSFSGGKPVKVEKLPDGNLEYHYQSKQTGCALILNVDGQSNLITGWRYASNPAYCRKTYSYGHAW
jgi:hypothetical protein